MTTHRHRATIGARRALAVVGLVFASLLAVPGSGSVASAATWSDGECATASGITVVVDFQDLGGGVNVRCAAGPTATGLAALDAAGVNYQTALRSSGFVCRIAGKPSSDPCINPSPLGAYWSYWIAPRGGTWCYSAKGAGYRSPPAGTVEGWSFARDRTATAVPPPRYAVPAAIAGAAPSLGSGDCDSAITPTAPTTTPGAPVTTSPPARTPTTGAPAPATTRPPSPGASVAGASVIRGSSTTTTPVAATAGATGTGGDGATTTTAAAAVDPATSTTPTTTVVTAPTTTALRDPALAAATRGTVDLGSGGDDGGSPVGVIVVVGLVGALGAAGTVVARRRRRTTR